MLDEGREAPEVGEEEGSGMACMVSFWFWAGIADCRMVVARSSCSSIPVMSGSFAPPSSRPIAAVPPRSSSSSYAPGPPISSSPGPAGGLSPRANPSPAPPE